MIGTFVRQLNESVRNYFSSNEDSVNYPMSVWFEPNNRSGSLRRRDTGRLIMQEEMPKLRGETRFLNETEVSFIVPFIRLNESYLVGEGRTLNLELDLPISKVRMQVLGQRYEQVGKHTSVAKYLIGAKIVHMSQADSEIYRGYLINEKLLKNPKNSGFAFEITKG